MKRKLSIFLLVIFIILCSLNIVFAFEKVRFIVISDPHVRFPTKGVTDEMKLGLYSVELLENTIKAANETQNLDFVLFLGDLTKNGEAWNLDKFVEIASKLNVPFYTILGNHDQSTVQQEGEVYTPGVSKSTVIWALQGHGFKGPEGWWSLDPVPGLHIIGLDTNVIGTWGGHVSEKQLEWLDNDLNLNKDKLTIVAGHHCMIPFGKEEENPDWKPYYIDNWENLTDLFDKYNNVSFYLSGHRHISTRYLNFNGVNYIFHPSTASYPMRYTLYELTPEYLSYEVRNVPVSETIRQLGKEIFLKYGGDFLRGSNMPATDEGNKKYLDYYESNNTSSGKMEVRFKH